jgi:ribosomal protein S6--L-glutamate ligase
LLKTPLDVARLNLGGDRQRFFLAQRYVHNDGYDVKVYNTGRQIYAVARQSPLHPQIEVHERLIPVTRSLRRIAARVRDVFSLSVYGVDFVRTRQGWVAIDVNDFPGFGLVPQATKQIGQTILEVAAQSAARGGSPPRTRRQHGTPRELLRRARTAAALGRPLRKTTS